MKALITGIDGFTGQYIADKLKAAGHEVFGLVQVPHTESPEHIFVANLLDSDSLNTAIGAIQPDWVIHLAAVSFVAHGDASAIYQTNVIGTRNLLQAFVDTDTSPKSVLLASSANIYGNAPVEVIDESTPAQPMNDYAVSKLAMEYMSHLYSDRLPIVITRPFNYSGVNQSPNFLLPKIIASFARRDPEIELGNLDVARDFSDVRMVSDCYHRLLECPEAIGKVFNVCSGRAYALDDVLAIMESISGHSLNVRVNPAFVRDNEVKSLRGSQAHLESTIGPIQSIPLEETLGWMLEKAST